MTREIILQHARTLPASPQVLAGVCELLQDVNTSLERISEEIRLEPALAARVIRLSNSAVFGGGQRVGSVDEAVNRVGFNEVLRLVGTATVAGLVDRSLGCYGLSGAQLREAVLLHALAAEALAGRTDVDHRNAYAGGLLRGIGMMVLDRIGRTRPDFQRFNPEAFATYAQWEISVFGVSANDVTTMVLDEWRFPREVVAGLQDHVLLDDPEHAERFACVLNVAGAVVAAHAVALPGEAGCWQLSEGKLRAAGLDAEAFASADAAAFRLFEGHRSVL